MFHILGKIPDSFYLACSGGSDSMVFADFLLKFPKKQKFEILHFNHGTECCDEAEKLVTDFCREKNIRLHVGRIEDPAVPEGASKEDFWHKARYSFFGHFGDRPIVMCHHLNDCVETWVMTAMTGNPTLISYSNEAYGIIRPFLAVPKTEIESWAERHKVRYATDRSNFDKAINRNFVRHELMAGIRRLNPGIETTIRHKVEAEFKANIRRITGQNAVRDINASLVQSDRTTFS